MVNSYFYFITQRLYLRISNLFPGKIFQSWFPPQQGNRNGIWNTELGINLGIVANHKRFSHHFGCHFRNPDLYLSDIT